MSIAFRSKRMIISTRTRSLGISLFLLTVAGACATNTTRRRAGDPEELVGCHVEVYNDSDQSIVAYYDNGRTNSPLDQRNIGIINARDYRDIQVDCTLERIMVRGKTLMGDVEVIPAGVKLTEGVRKLANLRLPRT